MKQLSKRVQQVKPSPTLAVTAKANEMKAAGRDIVGLGSGEPDFDTPDHIKEAAIQALQAGFTKYTAVGGIVDLKKAVLARFKADYDLDYAMDQVLITVGGKQAFFNLMQATINPGDGVIIPAPYWVSYPDMTLLAGGKPQIVKTRESDGFKLTPKALAKAITRRSRFLVINSPSNPTGSAYTRDELAALGRVILKHPRLWVISDDIYDKIVFDDFKFYNIAQVVPELKERTIVLNGLSKAYSMTGWRLGYALGNPKIIAAMETIQSQSTSNPTSFVQKGGVAALNGPQEFIGTMVAAFKERRDYVVEQFNSMPGISCRSPEGAFYAYPNCAGLMGCKGPDGKKIRDSLQLADILLEQHGVAVVPGTAFGLDPYFRISYATSMANLQKGMERIRALAEQLTAK